MQLQCLEWVTMATGTKGVREVKCPYVTIDLVHMLRTCLKMRRMSKKIVSPFNASKCFTYKPLTLIYKTGVVFSPHYFMSIPAKRETLLS